MSSINETLKNITLKELCIVIISLFIIFYALSFFDILSFNSTWIYVFVIVYFIFKFRNSFSTLKKDILSVFSKDSIKAILLIVVLNIFLSYGLLYLSDFIIKTFPDLSFLVNCQLSSIYLNNSLNLTFGAISIIVISPISEELMFRGVMLNRLKLFVPTKFSIIMTSLLFASLHSFGSITSAFIFAMCMAILYLKTDNILIPIFAHFLNNLLAEGIVFIDSQDLLFTNSLLVYSFSILAVISFAILLISISNEWNNFNID